MTHSLLFDSTLELCDPEAFATDGTYWFTTLATGASFGEPQPVEVGLLSLLRDGTLTQTERDDNREQSFLVTVKSTDSAGLALGVAALHRAVGKRTTLVWTPPDDYGLPTVFMVETSSLHSPDDDLADLKLLRRNEQTVRLRLVCLPYARSNTLIVDDAGTPPSSGGTLLDNCESTTGWAKWPSGGGTYSVDSVIFTEGAGSLKTLSNESVFYDTLDLYALQSADELSGQSFDTDTGGYLSVAVRTELATSPPGFTPPGLTALYMQVDDGAWVAQSFLAVSYDADGFVHYAWPVDAGLNVTGLRSIVSQYRYSSAATASVWYDDIELLPSATTDHQITKQITVQGSARTPASLRVAAPSESIALSHVLVATMPTAEIPAGFQPDGARWVTNGTTTVDATALYGTYYTPHTTAYTAGSTYPVFDVPVGMLTAGPYSMVALVKAESSTLTFGVQAQLNVDGTLVGPTSEAEVSPTGLTTGWQFVTVGTVYLPPLPVQNADSTTTVRLIFKGAKMADVYFIPAWQVAGRPVADFSIVDCGSGTVEPGGASSSLWIDSPSVSQPQGGWWRGPTDDRLNSQSAWPDAKKPGIHTFPPGSLTGFLVSLGAAGPTLTLSYYPYWYGMAAPVDEVA